MINRFRCWLIFQAHKGFRKSMPKVEYAILGRRKQKVPHIRLVTTVHWLVSIQQGNGGIPQTVLTGLTRAGVSSSVRPSLCYCSTVVFQSRLIHRIKFIFILPSNSFRLISRIFRIPAFTFHENGARILFPNLYDLVGKQW